MQLEQLKEYAPFLAVAAGSLLFAWSQKAKILSCLRAVLSRLGSPVFPVKETDCREMCPSDRFKTFYSLRSWCNRWGCDEAVAALDEKVLPTLVMDVDPEVSLS